MTIENPVQPASTGFSCSLPDDRLPAIVIGILSYNRAHEVLRTLELLTAIDYPAAKTRFIVIDNASSDGTRERVLERYGHRVEVLRLEENIGAIARNAVILGQREPYVFQFDEDCAPADRDTVRRAVEIMEAHPDIGALCFRSINQYNGLSEWGDFSRIARRHYGNWGHEGIFLIGNGMCYRSSAISRTRGFDPRIFWGAEELQLSLDMLHLDIPILYVPSLALVHRHAPRAFTRAQATEIDTRNNVIIAFTFFPFPLAIAFAAIQTLKRLLAALVRRREDGVEAVLRGARRGLALLPEIRLDRRTIPLSRLAQHNRWLFATLTGLRSAPGEPGDAERIANHGTTWQ